MPIVQRLRTGQMAECLSEAVGREIPVLLTCRSDEQWHTLRTKILRSDTTGLWVDYPCCDFAPMPEIAPGLQIGLSFKLKHHKHILNTVVEAVGQFALAGGEQVRAVQAAAARRMQRIQRRAYHRVGVPNNRSVLVTFWPGGLSAARSSEGIEVAWEGWVTNLSAGGFQVRIATHGAPELEVGDLLGVQIDLGQEFQAVLADAQFRQEVIDERGVRLQGFQFVGLNESEHGQNVLRRIGELVCEFHCFQDRRHVSRAQA